jgi:hypothetical protein
MDLDGIVFMQDIQFLTIYVVSPYAWGTKILLASSFAYPGHQAWQATADTAISSIQRQTREVSLVNPSNAQKDGHSPSAPIVPAFAKPPTLYACAPES